MTKSRRYLISQGQVGVRQASGGMDIDSLLVVSQPTSILVGAMPFEVEWWRCPLVFAADAVVATLADSNPTADAAYNYQIQEASLTLSAAFAAAPASFQVLVRLWRAGVLIGTIATFDASVLTFAAHVAQTIIAGFGFTRIQPGDIVTYRVVQNGAGATCPPFLLTLDGQV